MGIWNLGFGICKLEFEFAGWDLEPGICPFTTHNSLSLKNFPALLCNHFSIRICY